MNVVTTMLGSAYEHARKAAACVGVNDRAAALIAIRETLANIEAAGARMQRIQGAVRPGQTTRPEDD